MPEKVTINLGKIPILLVPDTSSGQYNFVKKTAEFQCDCQPQLTLDICCGWFPNQQYHTLIMDINGSRKIYLDNNKWVFQAREHPPSQLGIFPQDFNSGVIHVAAHPADPNHFIFPLAFPMGELLMMNLLGRDLGILLHACGVVYQGEGYLFAGHGSAGKTTTARFWQNLPGAQVVNDDKVILRKKEGAFWMYGTPWHGEGGMALPLSAPLKRVFILNQAPINAVKPLPTTQAVGLLLARGFVPLWDADKIAFSLDFLGELVQTLPCMELGFKKDPSVVDFVLNLP